MKQMNEGMLVGDRMNRKAGQHQIDGSCFNKRQRRPVSADSHELLKELTCVG